MAYSLGSKLSRSTSSRVVRVASLVALACGIAAACSSGSTTNDENDGNGGSGGSESAGSGGDTSSAGMSDGGTGGTSSVTGTGGSAIAGSGGSAGATAGGSGGSNAGASGASGNGVGGAPAGGAGGAVGGTAGATSAGTGGSTTAGTGGVSAGGVGGANVGGKGGGGANGGASAAGTGGVSAGGAAGAAGAGGSSADQCNPLDPTACPGARCGLVGANFACEPAGTGADQAPCSYDMMGHDSCAAGLACILNPATCYKICDVTKMNADCATGEMCDFTINVQGGTSFHVCQPTPPPCDPLAQSCTTMGTACYPTFSGDQCATVGTKPNGSACVFANDCVAGSVCETVNSVQACYQICDPAGGIPKCTTGMCMMLNAVTYGLCM